MFVFLLLLLVLLIAFISFHICVRFVRKTLSIMMTPTDIRTRVKGLKLYTTFDETSAFNQIRLAEETAMRTGVHTPLGVLVHDRMFFGGEPFPGIMTAVNTKILSGHPRFLSSVFVYMDDVIIATGEEESLEDHLALVDEV